MKAIQYEDLCRIGQILSTEGMNIFLRHINNCKKCQKMYKKILPSKTLLNVTNDYIGETIEQKIRRIVNNNEPITDGAPLIYTERKNGVEPQYDIRTDRFEIAIDAMDKVSKTHTAKRAERASIGEQAKEGMKKENGGTESIQAT